MLSALMPSSKKRVPGQKKLSKNSFELVNSKLDILKVNKYTIRGEPFISIKLDEKLHSSTVEPLCKSPLPDTLIPSLTL